MLALEVTFRDDHNEPHELVRGYIYRQGSNFTASSSEDDIKGFLLALVDTAPYSKFDEDEKALRDMGRVINGGVNRFSYRGCRIVEREP